ncbi:MAG TPA: hypothetical protein EYP41_03490 [Anaerolineae bacterium]|nr:hypothetical protein [Anaerolineae bacterium]
MTALRFLLLFFLTSPLFAVDIQHSDKSDHTIKLSDSEVAEHYGLSLEQYQKYKRYMEIEGKYHYAHMDPLFVSGLIAETEQERKQFAERFYNQELRRQANFLKFNDLFRAHGKKVRGDNPVVSIDKLSQLYNRDLRKWRTPAVKPQMGDRITYFVDKSCGQPCSQRFKYYLSQIGGKYPVGTAIDVYFIGYERKEIESWARSVNINPDAVKAGTVTLNFDDRYEKVFGAPGLPAAFLVRNNQVLGKL